MLPSAVSDHYRAQQRLIVATLGLTRREWSTVTWDNIDDSWAKVAPRVNLLTASAQLGAATNGAAYVGRTLADLGQSVDPLGAVNPRAFAGFASDGRPLGSLLEGAKARAKMSGSLDAGGRWLDMAVHTQIADAGRGAAATAIAVRPGVGWVRMVNPPCCGPCAVLSGREYRYSQGFDRHPRCDCVHVPTTDTAGALDNLTTEPTLDQIKGLTEGERKALLEGGDLSRVINARRGGGLGKMSTTELAKRGRVRLTPDGIFATAKGRDEALRLLQSHGYITPTARRVAATSTRGPLAAPVVPSRASTLTVAQSKALDPTGETSYSAATRFRVVPELSKTDAGRILGEAAERWQLDKSQVRAIRMVADMRLAGQSVDNLPAMAGLDAETLLRYTDSLLDGVRDYAGAMPEQVFRGISARAKIDDLAAQYAEGSRVDIGLSSWTSAEDIAEGFIRAGNRGEVAVMLRLEGPTSALPMQNLTTSRAQGLWTEKEWLTAGRFDVVSVKRMRGRLEVTVRQVVGP